MSGSEPTSNDNPVTYKEAFQAAQEGNSDKLLAMIAADENVLNIADSNQSTPLTVAFAYGQLELARLLIERGANLFAMNHSSKWGMRYIVQYEGLAPDQREKLTEAAMASEMYSSFEMFKLLVELGADVHAGNDSSLRGAIWQHAFGHWNYENVIRYLVEKGSKPRGFFNCAMGGNLALAKLLIELGADVNETDEIGFYEKRLPNREGHTALDYCTGIAGEHKHPEIAALLLEHGAKHKSELDSR